MKRLLLLSWFYPPLAGGGVHRVLSFTRHLPAHGWACTVVCAGEDDYWVRDDSLLALAPRETEVIRVPGASALSAWLRLRGGARRGQRSGGTFSVLRSLSRWWLLPDSYAGWIAPASRAALARVERGGVHAVLSSSPPDSVHLAALRVRRRTGLPWVADFRDPWIGSHFFRPPTPWHAARHRAMEARVVGGADLVLAASRTHADELAAGSAGAPRRLLWLPNGFEPVPETAPAAAGPFRIVFTGTLSLMEDAGTLLAAVRALLEREPAARADVRVELAGPHEREWTERAAALGLAGVVRLAGPLAHADARALQRAADVLMLWKPSGEEFRTMVPGKLYEYLDSARPIVALLRPGDEAAALVERAGGTRLDPGDDAALARELLERYRRWRSAGRAPDSRPEWLASHTRAHLAGELARALDALAAGGGA